MVMETPSAQCVGREFVRQYYTLLHEAPEYLHRFYSHNSCFVHGGVEKPGEEQPPVQGQADIHKKILSLNFRDCHAKIRQVDSQSTVGSAVVVQVTGELSNNGQPMRRFMQTFILAPQSPKKYYVHNDIFRYQDEVFHDNDNDAEIQEDPVTDDVQYHADSETDQADTSSQPETAQEAAVSYYDPPPPPTQPAAASLLSNGNSAHSGGEERPETPEEEKVLEEPAEKSEPESEPIVEEYESAKEPEKEEVEEEPQEEQGQFPAQQEPKTNSWAFITSKNTNMGNSMNSKPQSQPIVSKPVPPPQQQQPMKPIDKGENMGGGMKDGFKPKEQRDPRPPRRDRDSSRPEMRQDNQEDFRRSRYPDSQQLFVGNLPHNIPEKELKAFFETYGRVVEVRINRKSNSRDVPNFGFVVFEDPMTVTSVLDSKPIMYRGDHRLNVEEKKQRSEQGIRPGSGNRLGRGGMGGGGGMGGMGRMSNDGNRGGLGGPGGRGRGGGMGGPRSDNRGPSDRGGRGGGGGGFGVPRR